MNLRCLASLCAAALCLIAARVDAAPRSAAEILPRTTTAYVEIQQPQRLMDTLLDHPLRARLEELDQYKQFYKSPQFRQFKTAVGMFEAQMEMKWRPAVAALTSGGVHLAFDAPTEGAALLVQAKDKETLDKARELVLSLARAQAQATGNPDPVKSGEYRGKTAYGIGEARFATLDNWLIVTNKEALGREMIDRYLDGGDSLAGNPQFVEATKHRDQDLTAWAFVDMDTVRKLDESGVLKHGQTENPAVELLVGGLVDNLRKTPYVTSSLTVRTQQVQLRLAAPHDPAWVGESRTYFFGEEGKGEAPLLLAARQTLLSLSTHRDVSQMWLRADDLFDEEMVDQLAQADSNLSTLFAGRDFGEEILGAVHPELQLVVTRQSFEDRLPQPAVKLPAFALVARMRDPEKMRGELRRTFVSLVGFLNVVGSMNGQPQLDFDIVKEGENQLIATRYLPEDDEAKSKEARINFNFSPTLAFHKNTVILSSTEALARELTTEVAKPQPLRKPGARVNTISRGQFEVLRRVLEDNRGQLIAQNILEQGNSREEAEVEIGLLLELVGALRDAGLKLQSKDDQLEFQVELNLNELPAP